MQTFIFLYYFYIFYLRRNIHRKISSNIDIIHAYSVRKTLSTMKWQRQVAPKNICECLYIYIFIEQKYFPLLSFCQQFLPTLSSSGHDGVWVSECDTWFLMNIMFEPFFWLLFAAYLEPTKLYICSHILWWISLLVMFFFSFLFFQSIISDQASTKNKRMSNRDGRQIWNGKGKIEIKISTTTTNFIENCCVYEE